MKRPSRFEKARAEALEVGGQPGRQRSDGRSCRRAPTPRSNSPPPARRRRCAARLQACALLGWPDPPGARAAAWPNPWCATSADAEIHLFSDGAVPELERVREQGAAADLSPGRQRREQPRHHRAGRARQSRGRPPARDLRQRRQFLASNSQPDRPGTAARRPPAGNAPAHRPAGRDLAPGLPRHADRATAFSPCGSTGKDDLAADNQASIVSLLPKPVKVLLVTRGNRLLEKALARRRQRRAGHGHRSDRRRPRGSISWCWTA